MLDNPERKWYSAVTNLIPVFVIEYFKIKH